MKSFTFKRPLFAVCSVFFITSLAASVLSYELKLTLIFIFTGVFALSMILLLTKIRPLSKLFIPLILSCLIALGISHFIIGGETKSCEKLVGQSVECTFTIEKVIYSAEYYGVYYAEAEATDSSWSGKVSLTSPDGSAVEGDILKGEVTFERCDEDTLYFSRKDKVFLTANAESLEYAGRVENPSLTSRLRSLNGRLYARLQNLTGGNAGLTGAVLLGNTSELPDSVKRDFSRLGISHLFAISGLHMSAVVAFTYFFLKKTKLSRWTRGIISIAAILTFMGITCFSVSVVRAGIMHIIYVFGILTGRKSDSLTALSLVATLIVIFDPYAAFDIALLLSVLATYACLGYQSAFKKKSRRKVGFVKRGLTNTLTTVKMSAFIIAATLPFTLKLSGGIPLLAPFCNVIFVPLTSVLLYIGMIFLPLGGVPMVSGVLAFAVTELERFILWLAEVISRLPHIVLPLRFYLSEVFVVILFLSAMVLGIIHKKHGKIPRFILASCGTCILLFSTVSLMLSSTTHSVDFISSGKNESFVIRDGLDLSAIDVSDGSMSALSRYLSDSENSFDGEVSLLVLTHYHKKHLSGVDSLCGKVVLRKLLLPTPENDSDSELCEKLLESARERGVKVEFYSRSVGDFYKSGDMCLGFNGYTTISRSSHPIISFDFELGGRSYLYLGGTAGEAIGDIPRADTVFVGSHPPVNKSILEGFAESRVVATTGALSILSKKADVSMAANSVFSTGNYK